MIMDLLRQDIPNTHYLDDLRRFTITYITWIKLLRLGAIILQELNVTRHVNTTIGFVVVSIHVRVLRITNKNTLYSSRFEFTEMTLLVFYKALASEDADVLDVGLVLHQEFIRSLLVCGMEEEPVGVVGCGGNGFSPKIVARLELTQHCSCHHECSVLPFNDTVLLRGVWS